MVGTVSYVNQCTGYASLHVLFSVFVLRVFRICVVYTFFVTVANGISDQVRQKNCRRYKQFELKVTNWLLVFIY